jgi:hypothetical protein
MIKVNGGYLIHHIHQIRIHLLISHWKGFSKNDVDSVQISWFTALIWNYDSANCWIWQR